MTTPKKRGFFQVFLPRRNRTSTAKTLEIHVQRASEDHLFDKTVRYKLHYDGTRARRPARCQFLTAQHRAVRIDFAREHQNWQLRHRRPVLFKYESSFNSHLMIVVLGCGDARENVTQTVGLTLSNLTGKMGAYHGLGRNTLRWSYRQVCIC